MSVQPKIANYWATPIGTCIHPDHEELNPKLRRIFKEKMAQGELHKNKRAWTNKGGIQWESEFNVFTYPEAEVQQLAGFCDQAVRAMVMGTAKEQIPPNIEIQTLYESWFHITGKGGYHGVHDHGCCAWCGCYYVDVGDSDYEQQPNSGMTKYYDPRRAANVMYENRFDPGLGLERPLLVRPQNGLLLLFPNYIQHEQTPYFGESERVVVAFNCKVVYKHRPQ